MATSDPRNTPASVEELITDIKAAALKGRGTFTGTVDGKDFTAAVVGLQLVGSLPKPYLQLIGRAESATGGEHVAIQIYDDADGLTHELGSDESPAWAHYLHEPFGYFYATSGKVSFDLKPTPTHVKGKIEGNFQQNNEPPRAVKCEFDIWETLDN